MSRILTVKQTADKLQMTPKVIRDYLRRGKIPGRKIGKAWRVVESDIELWVSTGQTERTGFVSARGLLKNYLGKLSGADVSAGKAEDAELEEAKMSNARPRPGKSS